MPRKSTPSSCALIPIVVVMHVPRAVATRSVGENASPLPLLSVGASVEISDCDGPCVASQCKSPVYLTETLTISLATDYHAPSPQATATQADFHRFRSGKSVFHLCRSVSAGFRRYILQPDPTADSKHLRYEKENHGKGFNKGSSTQSAHSSRRLCHPWPHHRQMSRAGGGEHRRISFRLSAR